jgi:ribosomal protein L37AE/L43A
VTSDDDEAPPICPVCGVTMVPAELSARRSRSTGWVCLECEETGADEDG